MADKLAGYTGESHIYASYLKEKWVKFKEQGATETVSDLKTRTARKVDGLKERAINHLNYRGEGDYSHVYRKKSRLEMVRISAAVMGIEFCYAAETAFVSPILLKIGVKHAQMTLIWCLSPFIGFFLTPILGSLSDNCRSALGRRRPFIILLSVGIILGLILVPNGKSLGIAFGDEEPPTPPPNELTQSLSLDQMSKLMSATEMGELNATVITEVIDRTPDDVTFNISEQEPSKEHHSWGVFVTIVGTVLLDFDADACQSPSRAYLLDVTIPEDHAAGLSTFTIMAGLGGGLGYAMGGVNWDATFVGWVLGGHVRAVFTLVTFIFIACVFFTLYSFEEIPLDILQSTSKTELQKGMGTEEYKLNALSNTEKQSYGAVGETSCSTGTQPLPFANSHSTRNNLSNFSPVLEQETSFYKEDPEAGNQNLSQNGSTSTVTEAVVVHATLKTYLKSIIYMPKSLRILCLTNLFCWMSLVSYSLYFTDFVGEAVFGGDPMAPDGSPLKNTYEEGVRFGCWGMAMYSLSCSAYSFIIEKLVKRFRARPVYICGQLVYSFGMIFMASLRHRVAVIVFSCCAGVMYSTLFTMPYLLVAHYHASGTFEAGASSPVAEKQVRGLGTDVAIVSSMVFLAQFILSSCMGSIVSIIGSTTAVIGVAAFLAFCGAVSASQVVYLDL